MTRLIQYFLVATCLLFVSASAQARPISYIYDWHIIGGCSSNGLSCGSGPTASWEIDADVLFDEPDPGVNPVAFGNTLSSGPEDILGFNFEWSYDETSSSFPQGSSVVMELTISKDRLSVVDFFFGPTGHTLFVGVSAEKTLEIRPGLLVVTHGTPSKASDGMFILSRIRGADGSIYSVDEPASLALIFLGLMAAAFGVVRRNRNISKAGAH